MKDRLAMAVYAAFGILLLILAAEWLPQGDPAIAVPAVPRLARNAAAEPETTARDTAAWATTILRRPLFSTGRRPQKSNGRVAQAAATGLPRLSGIMISASGRRAIFMPDGAKPMTLAEGATLDDYTIRHIAPDRVVLRGAKGDMVLRPVYDPSHSGGSTASPPAFMQNMNNQGFPQPGFTAGFTPPPVPPLGFPQPQPAAAANASDDDNSDGQPAQPVPPPPILPQFPGIRGPFVPRGRN